MEKRDTDTEYRSTDPSSIRFHAGLIFRVAYGMSGDRDESNDITQDVLLKFLEQPVPGHIGDVRNYIIRTTINHCLNTIRKRSRETYRGHWLPVPLSDPAIESYLQSDVLHYEMYFLMENLLPAERAVFILKEAFGFRHEEIAEALAFSEVNSRQMLKRARVKMAGRRHTRIKPNPDAAEKLVRMIVEGNVEGLIGYFREDIVLLGDGGGKAPAARDAIVGNGEVARFLLKIYANLKVEYTAQFMKVSGQPAAAYFVNDKCVAMHVLSLTEDGKIAEIFAILNPDKLEHIRA